MTYYQRLGLQPDADPASIKRAFRATVKALHPDTRGGHTDDRLHGVLEAYEVLSDPVSRRAYDSRLGLKPESDWSYRDWLASRSDADSQSRLVFYDLLRDRGGEALERYQTLMRTQGFSLERTLGRDDFMDCAFMLAVGFEEQEQWAQAAALYLRLGVLERERPFFRHFYLEVEERLTRLLTQKARGRLGPRTLVLLIDDAVAVVGPKALKAQLYKAQGQIFQEQGLEREARRAWEKARAENPKDRQVQAWLEAVSPPNGTATWLHP